MVTLVRKVLLEDGELSLERIYGRLELPLGEELLKPTKIYVKPILELLKKHEVYGMAHITGGGFIENIPRMLPEGIGAEIELGSWEIQPIFSLLQEVGKLEEKEMFNIFNMGIGMVVAVKEEDAKDVVRLLKSKEKWLVLLDVLYKELALLLMGHSTMSRLAVLLLEADLTFNLSLMR